MEAIVRQQYDRLADIYDKRWQTYISNTLSFLVRWVKVIPSDRILDVACGTGELERLLTDQYPQQNITGIDVSSKMLAVAQEKCVALPNVSFHQSSVLSLPGKDGQFEVVICANAFHYFDQPVEALTEMKRVLHPNGRVVILDWCRDFMVCRFCDWLLGWLDPAHKRCYTQDELNTLIVSAGLKVQRAQRVRFGLIWGLMVVDAAV
jgi:ubiquinone/menaquinone biosynthesis C-methylase UbiE